jgi:hypothetical protein
MSKTAIGIIALMFLSTTPAASGNEPDVAVQKLYLKFKPSASYNTGKGFSIIFKPYYGYDPDYIDTRVRYLGRNIARELKPVPKANRLINGYMWQGIGAISCIIGGLGIVVGSFIYDAGHGERNPDGTYETNVPAGVPIGFSVFAAGGILHATKPICLIFAVREYNKHARNYY